MYKLKSKLQRLNKCKYNLYYGLIGEYQFDNFTIRFDSIQSDPFAPPSKVTLIIPFKNTEFTEDLISNPIREYSFCDAVGRIFAKNIRTFTKDDKGSGNGGFCGIRYGMQKVLQSNAVLINNNCIELKVLIGLPGFGRSIAGKEALIFLMEELPKLVQESLINSKNENINLKRFVQLTEEQYYIRQVCKDKDLIAFIANDSILARASSVNDKPMSRQKAIPFESPKELLTTITLPNGTSLQGMGIPKGITLIAGGGFHGKSTLLTALSNSIYNHIPEDGREYCIMDNSAIFLRAEDGRSINGVDISPFIHNLPDNKSSQFFQTESASGSSSQAANLIESLEMNAKVILIDEDISATNFLIRDSRMRSLVPDYKETITPLIAYMKFLKEKGVSLIMVTGALGDFMDVADTVLLADSYHYIDATKKAKKIMQENPIEKIRIEEFQFSSKRIVKEESINFFGKKGIAFIEGDHNKIKIGREIIDMSAWDQLYDYSQYCTLAAILAYIKEKEYLNQSPEKIWEQFAKDIKNYGWDILSRIGYDYLSTRQEQRKSKQNPDKQKNQNWRYIVETRPLDWHAVLNRLRSLECNYKKSDNK